MKIGVSKNDSVSDLKTKVRTLVFYNNGMQMDFKSLSEIYANLRRDYGIIRMENELLKKENLRLNKIIDEFNK